MSANHRILLVLSMAVVGLLTLGATAHAQAQVIPKALKGKIITSTKPIDIPSSQRNFLKKMKKQDRSVFKKDEEGKWNIHFVAFFSRGLPHETMGVVVLDAKQEPVAIADVQGTKGQKTLASQIVVDTTESPGKKHTLQVYFAKGKKPVVLAKKVITLK